MATKNTPKVTPKVTPKIAPPAAAKVAPTAKSVAVAKAPAPKAKAPAKPKVEPEEVEPEVDGSDPTEAKKNNQLIDLWDDETDSPTDFDPDTQIIFLEPTTGEVPIDEDVKKKNQGAKPIVFYRVPIKAIYADGTEGPALFNINDVFSFGVQESTKPGTKILNGYNFGLSLYRGDKPTPKQEHIQNIFQRIEDRAKEHVLEIKEQVNGYEWETARDLKDIRLLRWKMEKGKRDPRYGPTISTKMLCDLNNNFQIISKIYARGKVDEEDNAIELDPYEIMGKRGQADATVKLSNIFLGVQKAFIVHLYDADFDPQEGGMRRTRPIPKNAVRVSVSDIKGAKSNKKPPLVTAAESTEVEGEGEAPAPKKTQPVAAGNKRPIKVAVAPPKPKVAPPKPKVAPKKSQVEDVEANDVPEE